MITEKDMQAGTFQVDKNVMVRGTKVANDPNNHVKANGQDVYLASGKPIVVFDVSTTDNGFIWGQVTPPGAPQAHFACIWDGTTQYMHNIKVAEQAQSNNSDLVAAIRDLTVAIRQSTLNK
jgi:hypothetical protein